MKEVKSMSDYIIWAAEKLSDKVNKDVDEVMNDIMEGEIDVINAEGYSLKDYIKSIRMNFIS